MDTQLSQVFEKYDITYEYPESLLKAIQDTRDKIHNLDDYETKTEQYIEALDKDLHKWIRRFITLFGKEKINTNNFVQLFSKLFSLLRIDKISIFNAGDNFKASSTRNGYQEFSEMSLGEQFFHIMKPREAIHARGNGSTCRYWAMFLMRFFSNITLQTSGKTKIIGFKTSRHVSNALKIGNTWFIIDVMENPCIVEINDPLALKMIDPKLEDFKDKNEVLDGSKKDERIRFFETVADFIAST